MLIALDNITLDPRCQPRTEMDPQLILDYVEAMRNGATFPPVIVYHDGSDYYLADGFHRVEATRLAGMSEIACDVRQGGLRDAMLHAVGANAAHGKRRTNADKRRAVETMLKDDEWSQLGDREIARRCAVTHPFVAKVRRGESGNRYHPSGDHGLTADLRELASRVVVQILDVAQEWRDVESRLPANQYRAWLIEEYGRDVSDGVMRVYHAIAEGDQEDIVNTYLDVSVTFDPKTGDLYPSPLVRALTRAAS